MGSIIQDSVLTGETYQINLNLSRLIQRPFHHWGDWKHTASSADHLRVLEDLGCLWLLDRPWDQQDPQAFATCGTLRTCWAILSLRSRWTRYARDTWNAATATSTMGWRRTLEISINKRGLRKIGNIGWPLLKQKGSVFKSWVCRFFNSKAAGMETTWYKIYGKISNSSFASYLDFRQKKAATSVNVWFVTLWKLNHQKFNQDWLLQKARLYHPLWFPNCKKWHPNSLSWQLRKDHAALEVQLALTIMERILTKNVYRLD